MSNAASLFSSIARGERFAPQAQCPKCLKFFTLGVNGTVDGCDVCLGATRAVNGYVIVNKPVCVCYEIVGDNKDCPVPGHKPAHWVGGE